MKEMRLTKLLVPERDGLTTPRPRLEAISDRVVGLPLTVLTAGGGFGKSTLLAAWAAALTGRARIAWLSVESEDGAPTALLEAIVAAVHRAIPHLARTRRPASDPFAGDLRRHVHALCNELYAHTEDRDEHAIIIIDDAHLAAAEGDGAVAVLAELLLSLPPRVHVVLASRTPLTFSPIAKLRAQGRVLELGETDLRFTIEEAAPLAGGVERAKELVELTEGWPIALGLTARLAVDPQAALARGAASRQAIFDFLAEEVLRKAPPGAQDEIFALAIPKTLDEATAAYLLDRSDALSVIERIAERGLYLTRIDGATWRFHQLFAEFLRERFRHDAPERERALRCKYASYLRETGDTMEALSQLIEAGDFLEIVAYVQEALVTIRFTDRYKKLLDLLANVPAAIKQRHPMLYRLYASALARSGAFERAAEELELAFGAAMSNGDVATACAAKIELGLGANGFRFQGHGSFAKSEAHFREALELAQRPQLSEKPGYRKQAHSFLGMALAQQFRYPEAMPHLQAAVELEYLSDRHVNLTVLGLSLAQSWMGDWRGALEHAQIAEELFRAGGGGFYLGQALAMQARCHLALREDFSRAAALADAAISALKAEQDHEELAGAYVTKGRCAIAVVPPDLAAAEAAASEAAQWLESAPNPVIRYEVALLRGESAIIAGREPDAVQHLQEASAIAQSLADPRRLALCDLNSAIADLVFGRGAEAQAGLDAAARAFAELGDAYHALIARAAAMACLARQGALHAADLLGMLDAIESSRCRYALASASRSATALLAWALRHGVAVERAEHLLGPYAGGPLDEIAAVAHDGSLAAPGRVGAARTLARAAPADQRPLLRTLAGDADPLVRATAAALLDVLADGAVAPIRVDVVGELRVHVGETVLSERDERWTRKRSADLLRLLAIEGPQTKAAVIETLWPQSDSGAETTLRVTLHFLRRALEPGVDGAGNYIEYDGAILRLRAQTFGGTDAATADAGLKRALFALAKGERTATAAAALAAAIDVFSRSPREADAAEWLRGHVRYWRERCVEAWRARAELEIRAGETKTAQRTLETAVAFAPLDETTICALLDLHIERAELEAARAVFAAYKRKLHEELELSPGDDALERYSEILSASSLPARRELSQRELEVLGLIARGLSNKEIAGRLCLSPWTVNNHVAKILRKLRVENRAAAVAMAGGLVDG